MTMPRSFVNDSVQLADKLQIDVLQIGMEAQNLSGDGQQKPFGNFISSPDLIPGLHGHLTFLSVLKLFPVRYCISWE